LPRIGGQGMMPPTAPLGSVLILQWEDIANRRMASSRALWVLERPVVSSMDRWIWFFDVDVDVCAIRRTFDHTLQGETIDELFLPKIGGVGCQYE